MERDDHEQMTTFVVSNGSHPEVLEKIHPTQLYVSLTSPDEEHFYSICKPKTHKFEELLASLHILADHPSRTALRITLANEVNTFGERGYAQLIELAEPDYVEIKSYMPVSYTHLTLPTKRIV